MKNENKFSIAEAGEMLKKKNIDRLIIIGLKEDGEEYEYNITTYGRTKKLCEKTGKWADELSKGVEYFMSREYQEEL